MHRLGKNHVQKGAVHDPAHYGKISTVFITIFGRDRLKNGKQFDRYLLPHALWRLSY